MAEDISLGKGQILDAQVAHLDMMTDIFQHGQQPHHERFPDIFGPGDDRVAIANYLRGFLKPRNPFRDRQNFSVCWMIDDSVKGYLLYQLYETNNIFYGKTRQICFVEDIAVDPDTRGLGGASMLLDYLNTKTDKLDNCLTSATIWNGNAASEKLFRKYGFADQSKAFYRQGKSHAG